MNFNGKNVVLGVTASIAAYKAADLCSRLTKLGANVNVVMTKNACNLISPATFQALSKNKVLIDTFDTLDYSKVAHIELAERAALLIIAPASANTIAKLANGIADNMLTDIYLANTSPVYVVPAMNTHMWENKVTQSNIEKLKSFGVKILGPCDGNLACGTVGNGKMIEPQEIIDKILNDNKDDFKLNVLVTAGPTIEKIDPVRYISNFSSGKMGYAVAKAAADRGANVTLISGPVNIEKPNNVNVTYIKTTSELFEAVKQNVANYDVVIQAAAPADYKPKNYSDIKIKKSNNNLTLELEENQDIAKFVGENKIKNQTLVGFAAETGNLTENAKKKLVSKNLNLIIFNDVTKDGAGFDVDTNIATLITKNSEENLEIMTKFELANKIIDKIIDIRNEENEWN